MYIRKDGYSYYDGGEQRRSRGAFLLLIQPPGTAGCNEPVKALVRTVALRQFGHWMMGRARVYGHSITVSGAYGSDGLICAVPKEVYDRAPVTLPKHLYDAWSKGGGWNSAGSEASAMRRWACENEAELRK